MCLPWRPTQAIEAAYWRITRRRVRARTCLRRDIGSAPYAYRLWIERVENHLGALLGSNDGVVSGPVQPKISIILTDFELADRSAIENSLLSVSRQSYTNWELLVDGSQDRCLPQQWADRISLLSTSGIGSAFAKAVGQASGRYVLRLRAGNTLPTNALALFVSALAHNPSTKIIYGDQDEVTTTGERRKPWLKPEWNSEMFLAQDYLSDACLIETSIARLATKSDPSWPNTTPYSLLLAATRIAESEIVHIPHIVCHLDPKLANPDLNERIEAVIKHLPCGATAAVGPFETIRARWPLPGSLPLVSIIIPTRDKVELLKPCITSILEKTSYPSFEILILNNQSQNLKTEEYFNDISETPYLRIINYNKEYNYSAINNFAAKHCAGSMLCLLNNDTEVITSEWLDELVRYAARPDVGAAGAQLLYDDDTIQHAGIIVGMGEAAGHAHRRQRLDDPGYFCQAHVPHFVSAVTAACLVVERWKFDAVGGLDEMGFGIAFNDVDFCLKLNNAGWQSVYVPQAVLYHYESKSRGNDLAPVNVARYRRELALLQERWGTKTYVDPLHHPLLDRSFETYTLDLGK